MSLSRIVFTLILAAGPAADAVRPVRAAAKSVQEFLAQKGRWDEFARNKQPLTIEGRFASIAITGNTLRFHKLRLPFHMRPGKRFPRLASGVTRIEVAGRLRRREGKLEFLVSDLRSRPSDVDTFAIRRKALRADNADDWYRLGKWAEQRGKFYEDEALKTLATAARRSGLEAERKRLAAGDWQGLMRLAQKAPRLGLQATLGQEMIHEAFHIRHMALGRENQPDWNRFAAEIARDLPGGKTPLEPPRPRLRVRYFADPLRTYAACSAADRRALHRILYMQIALKGIEGQAAANGGNGLEIAARIEKLVPERRDLAAQYRERELAWQISRVEGAGRSRMLDVAARLRRRKRSREAREVVHNWVNAQRAKLEREGAPGLLRLADEYTSLLDDQSTAIALLKKAWELSPNSPEITERLNGLGLFRKQGRWMTQKEIDKLPEDPVEVAIRRGNVLIGMDPQQVRRALAGKPTSVIRIAAARHVSVVWVYGKSGESRIVVHFKRQRLDDASNMRVTDVSRTRDDR